MIKRVSKFCKLLINLNKIYKILLLNSSTWRHDYGNYFNGTNYARDLYLDLFILFIGHIRICFHLPYRQIKEGIIKATRMNFPDHHANHRYVEE